VAIRISLYYFIEAIILERLRISFLNVRNCTYAEDKLIVYVEVLFTRIVEYDMVHGFYAIII
jgi:hypothetical protein